MTMAITFPRQNDAGLRISKTQYQENLVLIVVLVSVLSSVYPRLSLRILFNGTFSEEARGLNTFYMFSNRYVNKIIFEASVF